MFRLMFRKRRNPTPAFRLRPPYQPITGERADLLHQGIEPYCALMQVAKADTHVNYVVCRGYDTRTRKFYEYLDADDPRDDLPGIAVAKPYGKRSVGLYQIGQVFPAFLPVRRIGQNPGVTADEDRECAGHPADEDVDVELLKDDQGKYINWMLIDTGFMLLWTELLEDLYVCDEAQAVVVTADENGELCDTTGIRIGVSDPHGAVAGSALAVGGDYIRAGHRALVMLQSDSNTDAECGSGDGAIDCNVCAWVTVAFGSGECCGSSSSESSSSESSDSESSSSGGESESEGESSSSEEACLTCFTGVCIDDLPEATSMGTDDYLIAVIDGCLKKIKPTSCADDTSSSVST